MNITTFVEAGTIGGPDGELSFSFMPESSSIFLSASVPSDQRRSRIFIRISDTAPLRDIIDKLESAIETEVQKRANKQSENATFGVVDDGECVSVAVTGTKISLSRQLYEQAEELVLSGKSILAAGLIAKSLPWLGVGGAKEIARAIYEHQRSHGLRD